MDIPVQKVSEAIEVDRRKHPISLDQLAFTTEEEYSTWGDQIADLSYQNLQNFQEDRILLAESLKNLDKSYKDVIDMIYFQEMSQTQVAEKLGISQMQISRRIKKALHMLFEMIREKKE